MPRWFLVVLILAMILVYSIFCGVVARAAGYKNRSRVGWFLFAFIISPLFAALSLSLMGKKEPEEQ